MRVTRHHRGWAFQLYVAPTELAEFPSRVATIDISLLRSLEINLGTPGPCHALDDANKPRLRADSVCRQV
jgi:hypothetical protein